VYARPSTSCAAAAIAAGPYHCHQHTRHHRIPAAAAAAGIAIPLAASSVYQQRHVTSGSLVTPQSAFSTQHSQTVYQRHQIPTHSLYQVRTISYTTYRESELSCIQCFDAVGWAAGRASGL